MNYLDMRLPHLELLNKDEKTIRFMSKIYKFKMLIEWILFQNLIELGTKKKLFSIQNNVFKRKLIFNKILVYLNFFLHKFVLTRQILRKMGSLANCKPLSNIYLNFLLKRDKYVNFSEIRLAELFLNRINHCTRSSLDLIVKKAW
ncbi:hypothetical protein HDC92_000266 [Pedobacter sp. AK017]|nr:hypothetical protein [Pedobacter sp. AK017]